MQDWSCQRILSKDNSFEAIIAGQSPRAPKHVVVPEASKDDKALAQRRQALREAMRSCAVGGPAGPQAYGAGSEEL